MKKIFLFATACVALVGCSNKNGLDNSVICDGNMLTISVTLDNNAAEANGPRKLNGVSDGSSISFTWSEGDQIKVTDNNNKVATLILTDGIGSACGTFSGSTPEGFNSANCMVEYPAAGAPYLTDQNWQGDNNLPNIDATHSLIYAKSENGINLQTQGVVLNPQVSVLQLNLTGSTTIKSIVVVNTKMYSRGWSSPDDESTFGDYHGHWIVDEYEQNRFVFDNRYTLNLGNGGITLDGTAKPFLIVVPADMNTFKVIINDASGVTWTKKGTCNLTGGGASLPAEVVVDMFPDANNHNCVDLGLPSGTLWATEDVVDEDKAFFAWGATIGSNNATDFAYDQAPYYEGCDYYEFQDVYMPTYNKYTVVGQVLESSDDAASTKWGSKWRMPTASETSELNDFSTDYSGKYYKQFITINQDESVTTFSNTSLSRDLSFNNGHIMSSSTCDDSSTPQYDSDGMAYWSSTLQSVTDEGVDNYPSSMYYASGEWGGISNRGSGCRIRAVYNQ